jgi:hypothetical protein
VWTWICIGLGSGFRIEIVALEDKNTYPPPQKKTKINHKNLLKAGVFLPAGERLHLELGSPLIDQRMILYFVL